MVHWLGCLSLLSVGVGEWIVRLSLLQTWVDHDLARLQIVNLPVLADVGWCAGISFDLGSVNIRSDAHVSVVATCCNDCACTTDAWNWVSSHLDGGCGYT